MSPNYTHFKELQALEIRRNRAGLKRRLRLARWCLQPELRKGFGQGTFDFQAGTLTGDSGLTLCWKLRRNPEEPESYQNQQTTIGIVECWKGQGI